MQKNCYSSENEFAVMKHYSSSNKPDTVITFAELTVFEKPEKFVEDVKLVDYHF